MAKKRCICIVLTLIIVSAAITSSFADIASSINVDKQCLRTCVTDTILHVTGGFSHFYFTPYYLDYASTPNLIDTAHSPYGKARPRGLDGTSYGTRFSIYVGHTTTWLPNDQGQVAEYAKFKIHNADFLENNVTNNLMTVRGYITAN